jgi:hypothetical protein
MHTPHAKTQHNYVRLCAPSCVSPNIHFPGAAAPRLATAVRAATWQERRPMPSPSAPLRLRAWDDSAADEAAPQQADAPALAVSAAGAGQADMSACNLPAAAAAAAAGAGGAAGGSGEGGTDTGADGGSSGGSHDGAGASPCLPQPQPERQPSGTWPRGILKTSSSLRSETPVFCCHEPAAHRAGQCCGNFHVLLVMARYRPAAVRTADKAS